MGGVVYNKVSVFIMLLITMYPDGPSKWKNLLGAIYNRFSILELDLELVSKCMLFSKSLIPM